jgi:hypothetical protein
MLAEHRDTCTSRANHVPVESWIARWRDESGDGYVAGLVRFLLGVFLLREALQDAERLAQLGYFGNGFHLPVMPESWLPTAAVYRTCLTAQLCLASLTILGIFARPAMFAAGIQGLFLQAGDRLHYHHHNYALFLFSILLAFAPCDRSFVHGRRMLPAKLRQGPLWAMRLTQLQLSIIYIASSGSKLLDSDWRGGLVLFDRLRRYTDVAVSYGVPRRVMTALASMPAASAMAKMAIATELFIALGAWGRRTRPIALWAGIWFHLAIQLTSAVDIFSALSVSILLLFATPDVSARRLVIDGSRSARGLARWVSAFDWLERFRFEIDEGTQTPLCVVDRSGQTVTGFQAVVLLARCLPIGFPLWLPLWLLGRLGIVRDRERTGPPRVV